MFHHVGEMCDQWIGRCKENKCCRKAIHDIHYYCGEVRNWENDSLTTPPVCSDACINAVKVLGNDPIGKNIKCCECGKFSDVDQNNFGALWGLVTCKRSERNMENLCKIRELFNCSRPTQEDQFKGNEIATIS